MRKTYWGEAVFFANMHQWCYLARFGELRLLPEVKKHG